jgi:hypothetical protein
MVLLISTLFPYRLALDLSWLYRPGLVFLKRYEKALWKGALVTRAGQYLSCPTL